MKPSGTVLGGIVQDFEIDEPGNSVRIVQNKNWHVREEGQPLLRLVR